MAPCLHLEPPDDGSAGWGLLLSRLIGNQEEMKC